MPRPTLGETAMTDAERQACYRASRAAGKPIIRIRRPVDRRSLLTRGGDVTSELSGLQAHYAAWLESVPENLQESVTAEALRAIVELDLSQLLAIEPPRGFGRD